MTLKKHTATIVTSESIYGLVITTTCTCGWAFFGEYQEDIEAGHAYIENMVDKHLKMAKDAAEEGLE